MRKALNILLPVILILLNAFFILRALEASRIYPLSRIEVGGRLVYSASITGRQDPYGAKILSVNSTTAGEGTLYDALGRLPRGESSSITMESKGETLVIPFTPGEINLDLLWFFLILILLANIHFIYGIMVRYFRWNTHQSRLFFLVSAAQGAYYFLLTDLFSFSNLRILFFFSVIALSYCILLTGYEMSRRKLSRNAMTFYFTTTLILMIISFDYLSRPPDRFFLTAIFSYIALFGAFGIWKLIHGIVSEPGAYGFRSEGLAVMGIILCFILPSIVFTVWLFANIHVPPQYASALSLAMPLIIGNSIFQYNLFSSRLFFIKGLALLVLNVLTSSIAGAMLLYASLMSKTTYHLTGYYILFALVFGAMLSGERIIRRKLGNALLLNRDNYSRSLRNIENLASTHEDISYKIERVFTEISLIMGISEIVLVLFEKSFDLKTAEDGGLVEYQSRDSDLVRYFARYNGIIFKYSLVRRTPLEERITRFLDKRGFNLISPVASGNTLTGALLLGSKQSRELFSGIDAGYIETVSLQLFQMLENDRLLKNYIIRRRFEMELDIASYIQTRLFPKSAPDSSRLAISFYNRPFLKVTGDYFDFIEIDKKNTAIVIADISGHGLAAAMILSMTSSTIHALLREKKPIEYVIEEVNFFLNHRYRGTELITLFAGIYNTVTGELTYINAGHCPPVFIRKGTGEPERLEGRSKILGADPSAMYLASKFTFERGDELILFTDGAAEIYDEKNDREFGENELIEIIRSRAGSDIEDKINAIVTGISGFNEYIKDDITLIAVRFN